MRSTPRQSPLTKSATENSAAGRARSVQALPQQTPRTSATYDICSRTHRSRFTSSIAGLRVRLMVDRTLPTSRRLKRPARCHRPRHPRPRPYDDGEWNFSPGGHGSTATNSSGSRMPPLAHGHPPEFVLRPTPSKADSQRATSGSPSSWAAIAVTFSSAPTPAAYVAMFDPGRTVFKVMLSKIRSLSRICLTA